LLQPVAVFTSALDRDIGSSARQNDADRQVLSNHPFGFGNKRIRGETFESWAAPARRKRTSGWRQPLQSGITELLLASEDEQVFVSASIWSRRVRFDSRTNSRVGRVAATQPIPCSPLTSRDLNHWQPKPTCLN